MGYGEWIFRNDGNARPATRAEISEAKALFAKQGIDWKTGNSIKSKKPQSRTKTKIPKLYSWEPVDFRAMLPKRITLAMCETALQQATESANQLGAENAKLKNTIARLKKGAK